jgi:adenylate cyclase
VFDRLMADPSLAALGGVRRHMTVLFSDVRGFTAMSEKGTPEDVVRQLNEYFTRMVEVLFERRGTLDKFVGDMVMALFGAPLDDPDHADHAVETALAMSHALDDLNRRWAAEGRPTLDIGIGISSPRPGSENAAYVDRGEKRPLIRPIVVREPRRRISDGFDGSSCFMASGIRATWAR